MTVQSRRRLLKTVAAASTTSVALSQLPGKWVTPVVESVLVPAHATTSNPGLVLEKSVVLCTGTAAIVCPDCPGTDNLLVPAAGGPVPIRYCFRVTNTGPVELTNLQISDPHPSISSVTCDATTVPVGGSVVCVSNTITYTAGSVVNTATASAQYQIEGGGFRNIEEAGNPVTVNRELF